MLGMGWAALRVRSAGRHSEFHQSVLQREHFLGTPSPYTWIYKYLIFSINHLSHNFVVILNCLEQ